MSIFIFCKAAFKRASTGGQRVALIRALVRRLAMLPDEPFSAVIISLQLQEGMRSLVVAAADVHIRNRILVKGGTIEKVK